MYHKEYTSFLKDLQELGVVHVIEKKSGEIEDEGIKEKYIKIQQLNSAISLLQKRGIEPAPPAPGTDGLLLLDEVRRLLADKEQYQQQLAAARKELSVLDPWGEFSWETIEKLKKAGLQIRFFTCPAKKYEEELKNRYNSEAINELRGVSYFIVFEQNGEKSEIDAEEVHLPGKKLNQVKEHIDEIEAILEKTEKLFDKLARSGIDALIAAKNKLTGELSFDKVVLDTQKEADNKLMILEGWVPADIETTVIEYLKTSTAYYDATSPSAKDIIPIKLKNNKFAKLFEVIGDLYSRPSYKELDLTPFFAPFYWLFFGFCLGDAGYGLLILSAGLFFLIKSKKESKNLFKLVSLLGLSTIIFGIIGGTFFGISLYEIKLGFYGVLAEKFDAQNKTINDHLFTLALILGAIQIIFGMFIKVANQIKMYNWKYALGTIGWIIIILGSAVTYYLTIIEASHLVISVVKWSVILLGLSGAFLFNNPERKILINFGSGFWDAYNMATGIMGDLLSYIRLFALGISSAILGYVFNSLAMEFAPDNLIGKVLVMGVILLFGHGINLFMAALGSFVHPVRLTFVEFYKNSGFMGGGIKYSPFKKE